MNIADLNILLNKGEGIQTEYKEAIDAVPSTFYESVASFSNTDGGNILLGVADDGMVTGINPASQAKIKKDIMTAVCLLFLATAIQAQTPQTKLNQIELMKQFVGSWKVEKTKDTTFFWDAKSYGTGLEGYYKTVTNGKTVTEGKFLQGYDKNTDKSIYVELSSGMAHDIDINTTWFISKTKYKYIPFKDVSNYEKASYKIEGEFKSPDMFVETTIKNNKNTLIETYKRIK